MRAGMSGVPAAIEKSTVVADGLIQEHMRSRMYAMSQGGALDESIRTLIYLAAALADKVRCSTSTRPRCWKPSTFRASLSVRIFFEGESRDFWSLSMRDGTPPPSRSVLIFFPRKTTSYKPAQNSTWHDSCPLTEMEPLRFGSGSRIRTARGNGNWEFPQRT
jgi:hypothetical protein